METQQQQSVEKVPYWERVTKRMRSGKHLGRRYCQSHHLPHKPLYRPPAPRPPKWEPKVKVYVNSFTVKMPESMRACDNCGHWARVGGPIAALKAAAERGEVPCFQCTKESEWMEGSA